MKCKNFLFVLAILISLSSCSLFSKLTSNTSISPNNSFVLGDNEHGSFNAYLKNVSTQNLVVYLKTTGKEPELLKTLNPKESITVDIPKNTAIIIQNNSNDTVSVDLIVKGDTGLSMGYKK